MKKTLLSVHQNLHALGGIFMITHLLQFMKRKYA